RHVARVFAQLGGVLDRRQGVVVGDEIKTVPLVLQSDVLLDRTEVIADVQLARGLHAAQDALAFRVRLHEWVSFFRAGFKKGTVPLNFRGTVPFLKPARRGLTPW